MSKELNYGLIGCGMMGLEHIRNIELLNGARVAAVYDPVAELAQQAAQLSGADVEPLLPSLLHRPDLDALVIVSPNDAHLPQLEQIAADRPLPVLVEKPLYTDPAEAIRVTSLGQKFPHPIWVAMEYRYMPPIGALLAQAEAATGGIRMLTIREHRFPFLQKIGDWNRFNARTGGTLVEKCCHFFDLMRLILKSEPVRIMASGAQSVNHIDEAYDGARPDIWDNAYVIVDFANGARAMLELCMFAEGSEYQEEISAVGPAGKIEAKVPGPGRFWDPAQGPEPVPKLVISPRDRSPRRVVELPVDPALLEAGDHNGATFYQHQKFLEVVRSGGTPEVTLEDGARAVAMGLAAQRSASEGQAVVM